MKPRAKVKMKSLIDEKFKPLALISIYVNADKKIEDVNVIDCFRSGEAGRHTRNDGDSFSDYALKDAGFFDNYDIKPDTLYHAYVHCHWHRSSYEYEEYDMNLIILNIIEVMSDYSKFIEEEEDFEDQERLKAKDEEIDFESGGESHNEDFYEHRTKARFTYGDLSRFIKYIAEKDIRLAHRILPPYSSLNKIMGELYNEKFQLIEEKRWKFKKFLKYNSNIKLQMDEKGYLIKNKSYSSIPYEKEILITFDQIDNLEDDALLNNESKEILVYFYNAQDILQVFVESEKE